ncbi:MAG: hypothetical protein IJ399_03135 [Bacilli bacterium]|nr:hypothetical protein [Bacilli bacterium]
MEIIIFMIISIIVSLGIETANELDIFKEIANFGYKVDLSKVEKYIDKKDSFRTYCLLLIPGFNFIYSLSRLKKYNKFKSEIYHNLTHMDLFIKMEDEEFEKYLENPKSINAFNISFDKEIIEEKRNDMKPSGFIKITNGNYRQDNNDGTFNDINFRKEEDRIVITSVSGEIASLTEEEQIKELNKIFKCLYKKKVVLEKKSSTTLKKEILLAHRDEVLNIRSDDEQTLVLK